MDHAKALRLAEEYVHLQKGERALEMLRHASPDRELTWLWRANALQVLQRYAEAAEAAKHGLEIDSVNPYLFHALARAEWMMGNLDAADAAIVESLRLVPDATNPLALHALILHERKKKSAALKVIRRATELAPGSHEVRVIRALVTPSSTETALRVSGELLSQHPEGAWEHGHHAMTLIVNFRVREAADHFARAVVLEPHERSWVRCARVTRHWFFWPLRVTSPASAVLALYSILPLLLLVGEFSVLWPVFWASVAWSAYFFALIIALRFASRT